MAEHGSISHSHPHPPHTPQFLSVPFSSSYSPFLHKPYHHLIFLPCSGQHVPRVLGRYQCFLHRGCHKHAVWHFYDILCVIIHNALLLLSLKNSGLGEAFVQSSNPCFSTYSCSDQCGCVDTYLKELIISHLKTLESREKQIAHSGLHPKEVTSQSSACLLRSKCSLGPTPRSVCN